MVYMKLVHYFYEINLCVEQCFLDTKVTLLLQLSVDEKTPESALVSTREIIKWSNFIFGSSVLSM